MRRSLDRRRFSVSGVAPGEVLVASTFQHPSRGVVDCPAAPMVTAGVRARGVPVRQAPLRAAEGNAILHTVSYVDPGGQVVGLGVAAHRADQREQTLAEDIIRTWAEVMRTRRVLLESTGPSCAGLRRLAAMVVRIPGPVALLAGGRQEVQLPWPRPDVGVVERLADVPDGATVVLPAHGVDPRTAAEARASGLSVVDATCPLVARTHATARRLADDGARVVVLGGGRAAEPIADEVPESTVITSVEEIDGLVVDPPARVAFVVSPGIPVEDAGVLAARLRSRFAGTIGQHPDEYCYSASDRRATVRAVASCSELTLVLGTPDSPDTGALVTAAAAVGGRVEQLDELDGLRPEWLRQATSVGILVGATARPGLSGELVEVLAGLGPLSITHRQVATQVQAHGPVPVSDRRAS